MDVALCEVYSLLSRLGLSANYAGFRQAAVAIQLAVQNPDYLILVSKRLYPEVANQFHTTWQCVERNIRTLVQHVWKTRPEAISAIAQWPKDQKPTVSQFIALMASYFLKFSSLKEL